MTWEWIVTPLVLGAMLLPVSLYLHRSSRVRAAKGVDVIALAWLFFLVNRFGEGQSVLMGVLMFLGCFHLALLMGWVPIRRDPG